MSSSYNGTVIKNRTWSISVTWETDNTPVNLTGYTLRMQVKSDPSSSAMVTLSSSTGEIVITDATAGKFTINMSATNTNKLVLGKHIFDVLAISPGGERYTVFDGVLTSVLSVTS